MSDTFSGYVRPDGRVGVRDHVLVLAMRSVANVAARRAVAGQEGVVAVPQELERPDQVDGERVRRTLAGFATSPNVGGLVLVGLDASDGWLAEHAAEQGVPCAVVTLAEHRGTNGAAAAAAAAAARLRAGATTERRAVPVRELIVGLECGGSDALSGITANPALGVASDRLVAAGGGSILAEIPELIGAEESLAARAVSAEVAAAVRGVIDDFERSIRDLGVDVRGAQPSPGNQAGGLTTIEEKALGSAKKGGKGPISGVLDYGEACPRGGLYIMDTPGHDIEQMVGMVAGGAQVVAFTTGRGTPTGSPIAPCLKIATNSEVAARLAGDIDLDAGVILTGAESVESMGEVIYARLLAVASGELTAAERNGDQQFALSVVGV
ncbi:MAG: UxaA family hydrolase [Actinomycetota bacterium]|nr:UxaA family hydrolase [Actinomycetota bacterium]